MTPHPTKRASELLPAQIHHFNCGACDVVSIAPFITHGFTGPVQWPPHCKNDLCKTQWWNK